MNLHEYQGKEIFERFGIPTPESYVASNVDEAVQNAKRLYERNKIGIWALKAQVHAGGRGKAGGVKIANNLEEVQQKASQILGMRLVTPQTGQQGKLVRKIIVQTDAYAVGKEHIREFYFSILLNRKTSRNMIVYSTEGGTDIEAVAALTPHLIFKEEIHPAVGVSAFQCRKIAFNLGLQGEAFKNMVKLVPKLYKAFIETNASLIEINPLAKIKEEIIAVDAKFSIDNNALFKQPDVAAMRDLDEEDPTEVEASSYGLNYIKLDGNVGCMVNGAGLAMATMDIIKLYGGDPANFLDVGGSADAKRVEQGFRIILKDPNVKAILVNIFGGIVRCDRVANGIVQAYSNIGNIGIPIIVRLQGTNAIEAKEIIENSGLKVYYAEKLEEAAQLVKALIV